MELSYFLPIICTDSYVINLSFKLIYIDSFLWKNIKYLFVIFSFLSSLIIGINITQRLKYSKIYSNLFNHNKNKINLNNNSLSLIVGKGLESNNNIIIPEYGLYQNILITGTIGSGKTSSAMYPFTKQLINFKSNDSEQKLGMLILDVKGNYFSEVSKYVKETSREQDLIEIKIKGKYFYNPLDKPFLQASVIANQLKTILLLFSPNNSESYWLDKAESVLTEAIKLCRLYNDNYVTFSELHNIITKPDYYKEKIFLLRNKFTQNKFNKKQVYNLLSAITFFEKEFLSLDDRTLNILRSEITRITGCFVSDYEVENTFCPKKEKINFYGFKSLINSRKNCCIKYEY